MAAKKYPAPKHPDPIKPPTHKDMLGLIAMASHYAICDPEEMRKGIDLLSAALYKLGIHQYFSGGWFGGLVDVRETTYQSDLSYNKFQWLCLIKRLSTFKINNEED
jgi:hypothetical protein